MGFEDFKNQLSEHGDKVEQGIDKAADVAKDKFGHEEQVDQVAEKGKDFFGGDDQAQPGPGPQ